MVLNQSCLFVSIRVYFVDCLFVSILKIDTVSIRVYSCLFVSIRVYYCVSIRVYSCLSSPCSLLSIVSIFRSEHALDVPQEFRHKQTRSLEQDVLNLPNGAL